MRPFRSLRSALAALLAVCVALLGLAAVSPDLHEHICAAHADHAPDHGPLATHDHDAPATSDKAPVDDQACAVTLFASGCETPVIFSLCPPAALHAEGVASFTELLLSRTLRGPERVCGPPALA